MHSFALRTLDEFDSREEREAGMFDYVGYALYCTTNTSGQRFDSKLARIANRLCSLCSTMHSIPYRTLEERDSRSKREAGMSGLFDYALLCIPNTSGIRDKQEADIVTIYRLCKPLR